MRRALAFLTPLGGAAAPDRRTLSWFPVVGALIGAAVGGGWWIAGRLWPPTVAAALVVALDLGLTGMLHIDGLIDSADGLLPHLPRDRRLAVMHEPTVGAFGVSVAIGVVLLRFAALASMKPSLLLVAAVYCGSRTVMAAAARGLPYAREAGLASDFLGGDWRQVALVGLVGSVTLGALAQGRSSVVAVVCGMAAAVAVVFLGRRRVGGFTGDILGAAGMVGETVALTVAAARW